MIIQIGKHRVNQGMRLFLRFISFILVIFILFALATGCKGTSKVNETENTSEPAYNQDVTHSPQDEGEETTSDTDETAPFQTDTGTYQGRIDSNFIEIAISGVPKEKAIAVFMLSEELKEKFDIVEPGTNEVIMFEYYINENNQKVIVNIKSLN